MVEKRRSPERVGASGAREPKRQQRESPQPLPSTPPPTSASAKSASPRQQLEPAGAARVLTPARLAPLVPSPSPVTTIRARLPLLGADERVRTPATRDALGTAWRVSWYPRGQHARDDVVSIFVEMDAGDSDNAAAVDSESAATSRTVRVEFVLLSQSGDTARHHRQISSAHTFSPQSHEFGMSSFFARRELLNPANAFLAPDGFVEIEVNLHPADERADDTVDNNEEEEEEEVVDVVEDAAAADADASSMAAAAFPPPPPASPSLSAIEVLGGGESDPLAAQYLAYDSKSETGMVGLKNQGATCYMNSLLQTLFHLRAFRQVVYDTPSASEDTNDSVSLALQRVFYRLQTKKSAVSTKELTRSFGWSQVDAFMQHDVQELYRILCDRLEEKMKRTHVDGALRRLFEGKVRSFVQCVNVDFQSFRDESFYDLQLDVKGCRDLYASFRKYVELELLQGDNQYEAEGHGKQDAKKGIRFLQFPPVLNIQLKRFEYDPLRDGMVKIHDRFEFPKTLVLDEFLRPSEDGAAASSGSSSHVYHLHSVLVHSGDVHGGHYYVFIRPGRDIANSSNWYKFDDDQISVVDEQTAIEGSFGSAPSSSATPQMISGVGSGPSTPLYSAAMQCSSPEKASNGHSVDFQSVDVVPDDDRLGGGGDVYGYARSNGSDLQGASNSSSNSLMLPLVRSFSSAYMLVYVRDGDNDIRAIKEEELSSADEVSMTPTPEATEEIDNAELAIPESLLQRFHEEERAHARRKKMQQTEHLYMNVRLASDATVAGLKKITKTIDFSSFGTNVCVRIRIRRAASVRQLYQRIYEKTGVPVARQRLWKVITRENRTHRPDSLVDETLIDCVEKLIDEDASPKAPVRLFLQILNEESLLLDEDDEDEDEDDNHHQQKPLIHRHFLHEFTAPAAATASEGDDEDEVAKAQEMNGEREDEEMLSSQVVASNDADDRAAIPRLGRHDILLFIKFYDVTKKLGERLEYVGNILIDSRKTGAELAQFLHEALRIPFTKELVLYEEIQPLQISEIEMDTRLESAEIQNGDIICFQFAGVEQLSDDETGASAAMAVEKYPDVPQYFQYLLDRVEIVFRRYNCVFEDEEESSSNSSFSLVLLYSNTYDEVVDAVAAHLGFRGAKRLFLRLYQHSPLSNLPKKHPLRHAKYAGNDRVTLDELLTEFTERSNVLYYEILAHPITEIEAKRQVAVYFSIYEEEGGVPSPFVDPAAPPGAQRRVEFLVAANATVRDLLAQVRQTFQLAPDAALRACAVSHDGTRILQLLRASAPLDKFSSSSAYASSSEHALFVEKVPAEELAALANTSDDDDDDDDDGDGGDGDEDDVLRMGVVHFSFQPNTHVYIHTHGVPLVVHFRMRETVREVKERIRRRIGVPAEEFGRWNFAAVKELRASLVTEVYDDMDPETVADLPMARLEEWCGARFADVASFGLEHADPRPATPKLMVAATRRQEHGIRIRQS